MCGQPSCNCDNNNAIGHPVVIWPGWVTNDARNNGADVNPLPIVPLHYGNWAAMQVQLKNGLELSTFGNKDSYTQYLRLNRLLYSSASRNSKEARQIAPNTLYPNGISQPSMIQLANMVTAGAPNADDTGGTGQLAPGIDLSQRAYYG